MSSACAEPASRMAGGGSLKAWLRPGALRLRLLPLLALFLLSACSEQELSPEEQVIQAIESLQAAVEAGSLSEASGWIAGNYRDRYHPDKRAAVSTLFRYTRRHKNLYLFSRIQEVEILPGGTRATAVVQVAMTAQPVESAQTLLQLKADLYRFDVQLAWNEDENTWQVTGSSWKRANLGGLRG